MKLANLFKLLFSILAVYYLTIPSPSVAEAEKDCQSSLSGLSWTFQNNGESYPLRSEEAGEALHGVPCTEAEIIAWFEENSWALLRTSNASGQWFGSGGMRYRMDRTLVFCQPQPLLFGRLKGGCSAQAAIALFQGRITQIFAGPTK